MITPPERALKSGEQRHTPALEMEPQSRNSHLSDLASLLPRTCFHGQLVFCLRPHPELFDNTVHPATTETCVNLHQAKAFSTTPTPNLQRAPRSTPNGPFLLAPNIVSNILLYWKIHTKRDLSDRARLLEGKSFGDCNRHIPTRILTGVQKPGAYRISLDKLSLFDDLHRASIFEIDQTTAYLEVEGVSTRNTAWVILLSRGLPGMGTRQS